MEYIIQLWKSRSYRGGTRAHGFKILHPSLEQCSQVGDFPPTNLNQKREFRAQSPARTHCMSADVRVIPPSPRPTTNITTVRTSRSGISTYAYKLDIEGSSNAISPYLRLASIINMC